MSSSRAPEDDEALVRRARGGDDVALRTLFDRHLPRLRARARARLGGSLRRRVGESDIVQETWVTTSCRLDDFEDRGTGSFGRWLDRILENKIRDHLRNHLFTGRRDVRREVTPASGVVARITSRGLSPSVHAVAAEDRAALERSVGKLPAREREVIRLVHGKGHTLVEVAAMLGTTANAVSKVYGRAMGRLATLLRPEDVG